MEAPGVAWWAQQSSVGGREQRNNSRQAERSLKWTPQVESPSPGQAEELPSPQAFQVDTVGLLQSPGRGRVWPMGAAGTVAAAAAATACCRRTSRCP